MITLSIDDVTIERFGTSYQAFKDDLCVTAKTPMLAYIKYLKADADIQAEQLQDCFSDLYNDVQRMAMVAEVSA